MESFAVATESSRERIARAQAGDREAFAALVRVLAPRLRAAVASRIGGHLRHELEVEDVLQETYARAIVSLALITYGETSDVRIIDVRTSAFTDSETWPFSMPSARITSENSLI